jgi:hypothetical protein
VALQASTHSLTAYIRTLENTALVFRRACTEPPGQPLNLVNIILDPSVNLWYFASLDIMGSVTTGRPTCFRYEIAYSVELWEQICQLRKDHGLQWLHGLSDHFAIILAWINSLCGIPGASIDTALIGWVEAQVCQVKVTSSSSGDPALHIARVTVHECWRMAVLVYLYMVYTPHFVFVTRASILPALLQSRFCVEPMLATVGS